MLQELNCETLFAFQTLYECRYLLQIIILVKYFNKGASYDSSVCIFTGFAEAFIIGDAETDHRRVFQVHILYPGEVSFCFIRKREIFTGCGRGREQVNEAIAQFIYLVDPFFRCCWRDEENIA